jgi:hypothetical protein
MTEYRRQVKANEAYTRGIFVGASRGMGERGAEYLRPAAERARACIRLKIGYSVSTGVLLGQHGWAKESLAASDADAVAMINLRSSN